MEPFWNRNLKQMESIRDSTRRNETQEFKGRLMTIINTEQPTARTMQKKSVKVTYKTSNLQYRN